MLKETEETIGFFVPFLSLVAFQLGGARAPWPHSGYVYAVDSLKHEFKLLMSVPC